MAGRLRIDAKMLGSAEVRRAIEKAGRSHPAALDRAVYQQGMQVHATALPLTPVEFGVMRTSEYVAPPTGTPGAAVVEVGVGTNYAIYQHEDSSLRHPRGGEDHFLSKAVERTVSLENIARLTAANVESGKGTVAIPPGVSRRPPVAPSDAAERTVARKKRRQARREGK